MQWLKDNGQEKYINTQTKEVLNKKELKKQGFNHNGQLFIDDMPVKGVTITHQEDKFEIK